MSYTSQSFRTELTPERGLQSISHDDRIIMLGSCFTENVGAILCHDGFNVAVNPMGTLYNPLSIAKVVNRALEGKPYTQADLTIDNYGLWHCLDYESRRQGHNAHELLESLNVDFQNFADTLRNANIWIITFGTAWIFERADGLGVVGNCHKFPASFFKRRRLSVDEIDSSWKPLIENRRVIFTISPIRHLADGLHGNQLSKSTLLLATEQLGEYFPAYEALIDDLRDYRFYAEDMKHPSAVAVDYIYHLFSETYFSESTKHLAMDNRRVWQRSQHRTIL